MAYHCPVQAIVHKPAIGELEQEDYEDSYLVHWASEGISDWFCDLSIN
jgi:hypothetical protein